MNGSLPRRLAAGQLALWRDLLWRPAGDAHLAPPAGPWTLLAILAGVGLARDALSVALGIGGPQGKWYSFDPDIVLAMAFWPAHLLFFGALLLHGGLRLAGVRGVSRRRLLGFFFHLQALHLIVPLLDAAGFAAGAPHRFHLWEGRVMTPWYTNGVAMTVGVVAAWLVTFGAAFRLLFVRLRLPVARTIAVALATWLVIAAATYVFFPTFNTLFDALAGLPPAKPPAYWGYAAYFMLTTFLGMLYSRGRAPDEE